jgi:hypothetical protein
MLKAITLIFLKQRLGTWLVRRIYSKDRKTHDFCTKQIARIKAEILGLSPKNAGMKRKVNSSSLRPCSAVGSGNPDQFSVAVPHILFEDTPNGR